MWQLLRPALVMLALLTLLTGVLYPLAITAAAQALFPTQANGSLVTAKGSVVGSALIGQGTAGNLRYFWSRPSAVNYNPLPSGGSNLGPTSAALQAAIEQRLSEYRAAHGAAATAPVPVDMLFASGSGLDPHISPDAARAQVDRVAQARGLERTRAAALVEQFVEPPQIGFLGQPRVNVLLLNLALDDLQSSGQ